MPADEEPIDATFADEAEPLPADASRQAAADEALTALARMAQQEEQEDSRTATSVAACLSGEERTCAVRWWHEEHLETLATAGPDARAAQMPEPDELLVAVRSGEIVAVPDVANSGAPAYWREMLLAAGLRAALVLPLSDGDRVDGLLALYDRAPGEYGPPARSALVAELASLVLTRAAHMPFDDRNASYREAVVNLHANRHPVDVCRRAAEQIARVLQADWVVVARHEDAQGFDCHFPVERYSYTNTEAPLLARAVQLNERFDTCVAAEPGDLLSQRMRSHGIVDCFTWPITFEDRVLGVLQVGYRRAGSVDNRICLLADRLAFHVALALRDAELLMAQEEALKRLRLAQDEATEGAKFRALAQMAGGVAHEFNNALGGILGRAQMLQRQTKDHRIQKGLRTIFEIGWRAAETVRRLQEFTRERSEEDFEPVPVRELWQRLADMARNKVVAFSREIGSKYHVELEHGSLDGNVQANADELIEAISNVLTNALEATPGGGVVTLHAHTAGEHFYLDVIDRGRGMSEEEKQNIFDPFYSSKAETGVGLGLSVTYGIISRHRGEIEVDTALHVGTTVSVTLPLATDVAVEEASQPRILVIDDEEALCEVLTELFASVDYLVDTCAGGREGIERFRSFAYDLVCTDLRTDDVSGWEVIRAVKESGRGTPVMLLTGFRDQLKQDQIDESGVDAVLGKPFTLQQVLDAAQKLLGRRDAG